MYLTESLDENVKYDLHRTHSNNANKLLAFLLLFPVGLPLGPLGWVTLCSLNTYSAPKPNQKCHLLIVISFHGFNTDAKCSNQTQILPKTGHTVRLGTRGMVYYLDAGQELDKPCDDRNRPGTPFPSCPADIRYSNRHIRVKHMLFTFFHPLKLHS